MSNGDEFGIVIIALVLLAVIFFGGFAMGSNHGANFAAETHCISIGYDAGVWDKDADQIVCQTFETITE